MRRTDVDPSRTRSDPSGTIVIFDGKMQNQGYEITRIMLREYIERTDDRNGNYSLITVLVETDKGSVEMKYDEGYRGQGALESAATLLTQYVGLASLINRALIDLH